MDHESNILIIDDDDSLKYIIALLNSQGIKVSVATNGKLALSALYKATSDLILLNTNLPGTDGFEVCRQLKAIKMFSEIPVILLTTSTDPRTRKQIFKAGGTNYITKPYEEAEVMACVKSHLELSAARKNLNEIIDNQSKVLDISEERFQSLLEHTDEGFYLFEAHEPIPVDTPIDEQIQLIYRGVFVECNDAFAGMYGYTKSADIIGKTLADLHGGTDKPENISFLKAWVNAKYRISGALSFEMNQHGKVVWFSNNVVGIIDDGRLMRIWGTQTDVSEIKHAEDALSESELRFKSVIHNAVEGISISNEAGELIVWNTALEEITGISAAEVLYQNIWDVQLRLSPLMPQTEEVRKGYKKEIKKYLKTGKSIFAEKPLIREYDKPDGTTVFLKGIITAVKTDKGYILVSTTEDITDRKLNEFEIQRQTNELKALHLLSKDISRTLALEEVINIAVEGLINALHPDLAIFFILDNDKLIMQGIGPEEARLRLGNIPEHEVGECLCGLAVSEGRPVFSKDIFTDSRCTWNECKHGGFRAFAALPVQKGKDIIAVVGLGSLDPRDFESQSVFIETLVNQIALNVQNAILHEAVIKHAEELEIHVKQRTAQLQAANKELETFTYSVSHDLKAPLRGIEGYSKLLLDLYGKNLNEEATHFLNTIRGSTHQMNQLIEDLLEYSRLERSRMREEKINMKELIASISYLFSKDIIAHNVTLRSEIPDIILVADSKGLSIALRNLIENSIKFTRDISTPEIEIGLEGKDSSWVLFVKDNGIGFDMKYGQRIFEIFQRLHRAENFPGTGIGLAIVSKVMQRMHGKAWAESIPGKGSTFYLEIPK